MRGRLVLGWMWAVIAAAGAAGAAEGPTAPAAPERPSIVLVLVDTLRADYLGCGGFRGDVSPHLDRLCREGVYFEKCYSQAPWTKPAVATLFTSLDPLSHQVVTHKGQYDDPNAEVRARGQVVTDVLPDSATTLAEALHEAGYATAGFVANPWIRTNVGFAQGFETYEDNFPAGATADVVVERAIEWLKGQSGDKPFFLYVHVMDVHDPYAAPEEDFAAVQASPSLGEDRKLMPGRLSNGLLRSLRRAGLHWADRDRPERLQLRTWRGRYAAGVRATDRRLQLLLDYLYSSGLSARTAVVVTADHGEELYEHGQWAHGLNLHQHQLHVPLIVRPPGGLPEGRRLPGLIGLIDVAPTLLGYAGVAIPKEMRGRSQADALSGKGKQVGESAVYAGAVKWEPGIGSIQTSRFKLIHDRRSGKVELFDLSKDPAEQKNVAASNPKTVRHLKNLLSEYQRASTTAKRKAPRKVKLDRATKERLRALGYVQ